MRFVVRMRVAICMRVHNNVMTLILQYIYIDLFRHTHTYTPIDDTFLFVVSRVVGVHWHVLMCYIYICVCMCLFLL